ncbi:MAG: cupin domain-containing protein [Bacteroidia bacterium]|nr:cupin domain-containing protein [Bacteroidia bacterium]
MNKNAAYYIKQLGLTQHVEGGAYRETYRSECILDTKTLTNAFSGPRNASTAIYFLLSYGEFSAFHKIASDELWHFYTGNKLTIYEIETNGNLITHKLGSNTDMGETFQCVVKAGNWFGSRCEIENGFSLAGCTVAPGFDFSDLALADKNILSAQYPLHRLLIESMCY